MENPTEMTREEVIEACVIAARRNMDAIVPCKRLKNIHDGKIYSPAGLPFNFKSKDFEAIQIGYVFMTPTGTTYGKVEKTKEELAERFNNAQEKSSEEFRQAMQGMTDKRLGEIAEYWLKKPVTVMIEEAIKNH
jgi:hypothetical protein